MGVNFLAGVKMSQKMQNICEFGRHGVGHGGRHGGRQGGQGGVCHKFLHFWVLLGQGQISGMAFNGIGNCIFLNDILLGWLDIVHIVQSSISNKAAAAEQAFKILATLLYGSRGWQPAEVEEKKEERGGWG